MASVTSRVRTRLDALWKKVVDDKMLLQHGAILNDFLKDHEVRLVPHHFEIKDDESAYLTCDPPILFAPYPQSVIDDHPIDPNQCIDELDIDQTV